MNIKTMMMLSLLIANATAVVEAVENGAYSGEGDDIDLLLALRDAVMHIEEDTGMRLSCE